MYSYLQMLTRKTFFKNLPHFVFLSSYFRRLGHFAGKRAWKVCLRYTKDVDVIFFLRSLCCFFHFGTWNNESEFFVTAPVSTNKKQKPLPVKMAAVYKKTGTKKVDYVFCDSSVYGSKVQNDICNIKKNMVYIPKIFHQERWERW